MDTCSFSRFTVVQRTPICQRNDSKNENSNKNTINIPGWTNCTENYAMKWLEYDKMNDVSDEEIIWRIKEISNERTN